MLRVPRGDCSTGFFFAIRVLGEAFQEADLDGVPVRNLGVIGVFRNCDDAAVSAPLAIAPKAAAGASMLPPLETELRHFCTLADAGCDCVPVSHPVREALSRGVGIPMPFAVSLVTVHSDLTATSLGVALQF